MASQYFKNLRLAGFSLFEATLTIVISSIVLAINGAFVAASVNIVTSIANQSTANTVSTVALNTLAGDFVNNTGRVRIIDFTGWHVLGNTLTLQFDIPDTTKNNKDILVKYICDFKHDQVYRQLGNATKELFLDQLVTCSFDTDISSDQTIITLTTNITINDNNNLSVTLYEVIDAPYSR